MGIPGFYYYITNKYSRAVNKQFVFKVQGLYIDTNSLLHEAARTAPDATWKAIFEKLIELLVEAVTITKPAKTLIIAIDGTEPDAKIHQHRIRRFRDEGNQANEQDKEQEEEEVEQEEIP